MMRCRKIKKQIPAFLEGTLGSGDKRAIEAHIDSCFECRRVAENITHVNQILNGLVPPSPSPSLADRTLASIKERLGQRGKPVNGISSMYPWMRWATAVMAIILGIFIGGVAGNIMDRDLFQGQTKSIELTTVWEEGLNPIDPITSIMEQAGDLSL